MGALALPLLSVAGGGASAGALASAGSALLSYAGTALTVGSAVGSISSGLQAGQAAKLQARQAELSAKQEELRGRQSATAIRQSMNSALASQNAIFGARNVATGMGTPRTISAETATQASRDIATAQFGAGQASEALKAQAGQYRIEGKAKKIGGFAEAGKSLYSLVK